MLARTFVLFPCVLKFHSIDVISFPMREIKWLLGVNSQQVVTGLLIAHYQRFQGRLLALLNIFVFQQFMIQMKTEQKRI